MYSRCTYVFVGDGGGIWIGRVEYPACLCIHGRRLERSISIRSCRVLYVIRIGGEDGISDIAEHVVLDASFH